MAKKYIIKIWETEEMRNLGESEIIETNIKSLKEAINKSKDIMEKQNYASLEIQDEEQNNSYYYCTSNEEKYLYNFREENVEEKIKEIVELYFAENNIRDLMDYGADRDSLVMPSLSNLYKEILEKLNIEVPYISTEDISDGKYQTIVELNNGNSITIDTSAWNSEEVVSNNIKSIQEENELIEEEEIEF